MSVQVEDLGKNMAKLTVEVSEDKVEEALQAAYLKQKNKINIPGFRKGKVPRHMVEKMYGSAIFYEDAANDLIHQNYTLAIDESELDIASRPAIDVKQIEKGKTFIFTMELAVKPEVKLGKYKGITVTKVDTAVSEEEVDAVIEKERNSNARTITVEDRSIAEGDTAVIDFEGFVDGTAFEGGKGENHSLEIGSHSFIDTFEDQLIGQNAGDELDINVTFPEEYQAEELAGKLAVFKVKIHEIQSKEFPELDDDFAQDVSEFDTLAEYRQDVEKKLAERKEADAKHVKEDEAIKKIAEKSEMEIPDVMVQAQVESMIEEFAQRISRQGLSFEQYLQFSGTTTDKLKEQMEPDALNRIQSSLVLEQIVKEEKIEVSDDEVNAEMEKMAAAYSMEKDELYKYIGEAEKESMKLDIASQKALDLVMENAKERAKTKGKKDSDEETETE